MTPTVLVIDDSPEIHDLLEVRLRPDGVTLKRALSAEEGLTQALAVRPDLVLLDVDMPLMTGFEVCTRLKTDPRTTDIPIIFLTGADDSRSKVQGFDLGATDYVTKPFDVPELRARVRAALRTKRYQDLLATRAQIDALTTLWNRFYFERRMTEELAAAKRYGRVVSLVMVDVDHFKTLNDEYGHPFGDAVLGRVGEVLWASVRATDAPCRFGGEEFACILTETPLEGAVVAAQRIRETIGAQMFSQKGREVRITASLGVASTEGQKVSGAADLVRAADDALYTAKRTGRNRVCASGGDE